MPIGSRRLRSGRSSPCGISLCRVFATMALIGSWLWIAGSAAGQVSATIDPEKEYNVKGAYLYSFGRYVQWPEMSFPADRTPFVIGVLGDAPLDRILDRIQKTKTIDGRRIVVHHFRSAREYKPCHILFVARSLSPDEQREAIRRLERTGVLLVGETAEFARWGGVVNFFIEQESVRFEINVEAARREQLSIDAKLLSVASLVGTSGNR